MWRERWKVYVCVSFYSKVARFDRTAVSRCVDKKDRRRFRRKRSHTHAWVAVDGNWQIVGVQFRQTQSDEQLARWTAALSRIPGVTRYKIKTLGGTFRDEIREIGKSGGEQAKGQPSVHWCALVGHLRIREAWKLAFSNFNFGLNLKIWNT